MTEQIITFETAKLAKEKNFDWKCWYMYILTGTPSPYVLYAHTSDTDEFLLENWNQKKYGVRRLSAPTQSLLQKWLRDIYKMYISIDIEDKDQFMYYILDFSDNNEYIQRESIYPTYEQALEAALVHALNLIK